jgi:hypothetical protein
VQQQNVREAAGGGTVSAKEAWFGRKALMELVLPTYSIKPLSFICDINLNKYQREQEIDYIYFE